MLPDRAISRSATLQIQPLPGQDRCATFHREPLEPRLWRIPKSIGQSVLSTVTPRHRKPTNLHKTPKRFQARQCAHLGAFHIAPSHWHFHSFETAMLGDAEVFHIEAEAVQNLAREDSLRRIRPV